MELIKYISCGKEVYDFFKDGVLVINPNFTILYANKSAHELLNYNANELSSMQMNEISDDTFGILTNPKFKNILLSKKIEPQSLNFNLKNKKKIKVLTYISNLGDKKTSLGFMIIFRNPLNTGLNEIKSFGKLNPFTKALNVKKDEFCYVSDLKTGRNVFVSESVIQHLGWKPDDFMNGSWAFAISKTHPEDVSTIEKQYKKRERWYKYPYKYDHLPIKYGYKMLHKHGYYVQVKITVMLLQRDTDGNPLYTICFGKSSNIPDINHNTSTFNLTQREKEIGKLLVDGFSSKQIAEKIGISIYTVQEFRNNLKFKLKAVNSADITRILIQNNLV